MHKKTVNKHRTSGSSEQQILRISEFHGLNLGPEIGYPDWFFIVLHRPSGKDKGKISMRAMKSLWRNGGTHPLIHSLSTYTDTSRTRQHRAGKDSTTQARQKRAPRMWLRLFCPEFLSWHSSRITTPCFRFRFKFENKRTYV